MHEISLLLLSYVEKNHRPLKYAVHWILLYQFQGSDFFIFIYPTVWLYLFVYFIILLEASSQTANLTILQVEKFGATD